MQPVACAVEGRIDAAVAERLLRVAELPVGRVWNVGGKTKLDPKLPGYNRAASHSPWLVLRDLDHDDENECVPSLRLRLLGGEPPSGMCFRLAVREVEAWFMADRNNCATFFDVPSSLVAAEVESLDDPKQALVNLSRRSRKRAIREGMAPRPRSGRRVGPEYTALVREFGRDIWDPCAARKNSQSLDRALRCLDQLRQHMASGGFVPPLPQEAEH